MSSGGEVLVGSYPNDRHIQSDCLSQKRMNTGFTDLCRETYVILFHARRYRNPTSATMMISMMTATIANGAMTQPAVADPVSNTVITAPVGGGRPSPHAGSLRDSITTGQVESTLRNTFPT